MHKYLEKKNEVSFDKIFHQTLGECNETKMILKSFCVAINLPVPDGAPTRFVFLFHSHFNVLRLRHLENDGFIQYCLYFNQSGTYDRSRRNPERK